MAARLQTTDSDSTTREGRSQFRAFAVGLILGAGLMLVFHAFVLKLVGLVVLLFIALLLVRFL